MYESNNIVDNYLQVRRKPVRVMSKSEKRTWSKIWGSPEQATRITAEVDRYGFKVSVINWMGGTNYHSMKWTCKTHTVITALR